jgi:hypothetical protein
MFIRMKPSFISHSIEWGTSLELWEVIVIVTLPSKASAESAQGRSSAQAGRSAGISFMAARLSDRRGPVQ